MSFLAELKRRNVVRVGIAYVLMGWILLQGADFALDLVGAPNWVIQTLAIVVVIGLPFALFFAWAFEMTPEGIKRESEVDRSRSITPHTGRKLDRAIIVFLILVVAGMAVERLYQAGEVTSDPGEPERAVDTSSPPKSVAVLPFSDLSQAQDQGWFADGLAEEILNALAKTPDLLVASRTSSFKFKDSGLDAPAIAAELGVAHILEGSVRSSQNRIRVTAQLIRAEDGFHLWSQNYDRDPADMIAIQEDLARNIADVLETTMDPEALRQMSGAGTQSVEAYRAYLRGIATTVSGGGGSDPNARYLEAYGHFEEARRLDPDFAAAHLWAADFWKTQLSPTRTNSGLTDLTPPQMLSEFYDRIDQAIAKAPSEVDRAGYQAHKAQVDLRLREAISLYQVYLGARPNNDLIRSNLLEVAAIASEEAVVQRILDQLRESGGTDIERAREYMNHAYRNGRGNEAAEFGLASLERWPGDNSLMYQTHRTLMWVGRINEARSIAERYQRMYPQESLLVRARQACAEGDRANVERMLAGVDESRHDSISERWHLNMLLDQPLQAQNELRPLAGSGVPYQLADFLIYHKFDPTPFPAVMRVLDREQVDRPPPVDIPFKCPPPEATTIAVLPFVNMSSDPEQEFFSDGISEEILNALAQVQDLKVAGRTSSFAFKGKNQDLRAIGEALGVNHILEGSVRKAGNRIRITAQLIQVEDGFHLWSETYDREMTDVFAIQDEISAAILDELEAQLAGDQDINVAPVDLSVYDQFLIARQKARERNEASLKEASALLDTVIAKDPDYAPAWALRGIAELLQANQPGTYGSIPPMEAQANAGVFLDRALQLDPLLPEAHAGRGLLLYQANRFTEAEVALRQALTLSPNHVDAANWLQQLLLDSGQLTAAKVLALRIHSLDPLYVPAIGNIAAAYAIEGQLDQAEALVEEVEPHIQGAELNYVLSIRSFLAMSAGRPAEAVQIADALPAGQRPYADPSAFWALFGLMEYERAMDFMQGKDLVALALARLGRTEEALIYSRKQLAAGNGPHTHFSLLAELGRQREIISFLESRWGDIDTFITNTPGAAGYGNEISGHIAHAYRAMDDMENFERALERMREELDHQAEQGVDTAEWHWSEAYYRMLLNDQDAALDNLQAAVDRGFLEATDFTRYWTVFQPLLGDPRLTAIQDQMNRVRNEQRALLGLPPIAESST